MMAIAGRGLRAAVEDVGIALNFASGVPRRLRRRPTDEQALSVVERRIANREHDFLQVAHDKIFANGNSPYRPLLEHAGCRFDDLRELVRQEGVEGALQLLYRRGVYLSGDEMKARTEVCRGSLRFTVAPDALRNPGAASHLPQSTSGTSGSPRGIILDLASLDDWIIDYRLAFEALQLGANPQVACWNVPGSGGIAFALLAVASFGRPPQRWFTTIDPHSPDLHRRYRWSAWLLRIAGYAGGMRFPLPTYCPIDEPAPVLDWIAHSLRSGVPVFLAASSAAAVRLALAACARDAKLAGLTVSLRGEPVTATQIEIIAASGARCTSLYGAAECGVVGHGCLAPEHPDEIHVHHDLHASISAPRSEADLPENALLLTSIRPTARLILLNTSIGDVAMRSGRDCGCPLQRLWPQHLHTIRSYEKFTGRGMTFAAAEIIRLLEQSLPKRFGGTLADYQLAEEVMRDGTGQLVIRAHPRLGPLEEGEVVRVLLNAIAERSDLHRMMASYWRDTHAVRIERVAPRPTAGGKVPHFETRGAAEHFQRS